MSDNDAAISKRLERLEARLERLERLAVLPNFKLPQVSGLKTLDLPSMDLHGTRVLVKLDLDIPVMAERHAIHFKFARAALTIRELASRGASGLLLYGQGFSSVERLEGGRSIHPTDWQLDQLRSVVGPGVRIEPASVESLAKMEVPSPGTFLLLPDLSESFPDDSVFYDLARANSRSLESLCRNSRLVDALGPFFDLFVLDDFRSTVFQLPSNLGLASVTQSVVGRGLEADLGALESLVSRSIALGEQANSRRYCLAGSSRPDSVRVIEVFLERRLFDRVFLGVFPALLVYAAMGVVLSQSIYSDLDELAKLSGTSLQALRQDSALRLSLEYLDRAELPKDFLIGSLRHPRRALRVVEVDALASVEEDERVMGIGPRTLEFYEEQLAEADLMFHFGMLGASSGEAIAATEQLIDSYCNSSAEVFMAGDHILDIAHELGHAGRLRGAVTGAYTTSNYMTGTELPGIAPFRKALI